MLPRHRLSPASRRGVVLVLILGMLGLLALIGVTFASISGQAKIGSANFAAGVAFPDFQEVIDFGLEQLVNDTNNPVSALRGHSLKRDLYGNDSTAYTVRTPYSFETTAMPSTNQEIGNYLAQLPYLGNSVVDYQPLLLTASQYYVGYNPSLAGNDTSQGPFQTYTPPSAPTENYTYKYVQYRTNIPVGFQANGATYGLQFGRGPWTSATTPSTPSTASGWMLKLGAYQPYKTTSTVGTPDYNGAIAQSFEVLEDDGTGSTPFSFDSTSGLYMHVLTLSLPDSLPITSGGTIPPATTTISGSPSGTTVGLIAPPTPGTSFQGSYLVYSPASANAAQINVPFVLDGRYQNAFNGPGLMTYAKYGNFLFNGVGANAGTLGTLGDPDFYGMDEDYDAADLENWFLGLQSADGKSVIPSFHRPAILRKQYDPTTGGLIFDEWSNATRLSGQPTIADSRARILRRRQADMAAGFPADPVPDPLTGRITYDVDNDGDGATDSVWLDLGYPTQRDPVTGKSFKPMFAFMVLGLNGRLPLNTAGNLQGRFLPNGNNLYGTVQPAGTTQLPMSTSIQYQDTNSNVTGYGGPFAAGMPTFLHTSHLGVSPSEVNPMYALATVNSIQAQSIVYGITGYTPSFAGGAELQRLLTGARDPLTKAAVPGRWGEPELIPQTLTSAGAQNALYGVGTLNTLVRAGRSYPMVDGRDNDYDSLDFYPPYNSGSSPPTYPEVAPNSASPYVADYLDTFGLGYLLPSERARHFVTPADTTGTGRLYPYNFNASIRANSGGTVGSAMASPNPLPNFPNSAADFGQGADYFGRVNHFMYPRPAGLPLNSRLQAPVIPNGWNYGVATPIFPSTAPPPTGGATDFSLATNLYHGYEMYRSPAGTMVQQTSGPTTDPSGNAITTSPFPWDTMAYWSGAMPWNINQLISPGMYADFPTAAGTATPTMDFAINSTDPNYPSNASPAQNLAVPFASNQFPVPYPGSGMRQAYGVYPGAQFANPYTNIPGYTVGGTNYINIGGGALAMGEADQLNLYTARPYDAPFGPHDLEWLYRVSDVDGPSLNSRLSTLVPNILGPNNTNSSGSITNNRLFSVDSWDLTSYAWSPDNFPGSATDVYGTFYNNSRFAGVFNPDQNRGIGDSASFSKLDGNGIPPYSYSYYSASAPSGTGYPSAPALNSGTAGIGMMYPTPSVAHRGKKINLNFPLPPGDGVNSLGTAALEPVRQKWIRETYETLKAILPPKSIDTPEELAALSQFVINIVDFRDPDSVVTEFINTDIIVQTAATATSPATYTFNTGNNLYDSAWPLKTWPAGEKTTGYRQYISTANSTSTVPPSYSPPISPPNTPTSSTPIDPNLPPPYDPTANGGPSALPVVGGAATSPMPGNFLVQYGMEYCPIAITEILAFQFDRLSTTPASSSAPGQRLFVELVNTLTTDAQYAAQPTAPMGTPPPVAEDLDLRGWKLSIAMDDFTGRPDPVTGQPSQVLSTTDLVLNPVPPATTPAGVPPYVPAMRLLGPDINKPSSTGHGYYVLSNVLAAGVTEASPPPIEFPYLASGVTPTFFPPNTSSGSPIPGNAYYWLYLTRPANPAETTSSPQVVVDSFRFAYINSPWTIAPNPTPPPAYVVNKTGAGSSQQIYSLERLQPYRGGHKIPAASPRINLPNAFGFSEQTFAPSTASGYTGTSPLITTTPNATTPQIYQTLGSAAKSTTGSENWDYVPFHDRDFTSVAELMLVPGCPPGLFTKQFLEIWPTPTSTANTTPPATAPTTVPEIAHVPTFPYLVEEFYYTADGQSTADNPPMSSTDTNHSTIGWTTNAGWYKMLEMFDVPSGVAGAIGPVPSGQNFDWYRQDRRPGQINLNLIIDEEVFFGLIDDPRLNITQIQNPPLVTNGYPLINSSGAAPIPYVDGSNVPVVVTQTDLYGTPSWLDTTGMYPQHAGWGCFPMTNRGFYAYDLFTGLWDAKMKAAFADFLKLRHGGSGFVFGYGSGAVGTPSPTADPNNTNLNLALASDRPYRSLSFPDINYTVMRPSNLPPSYYTALTNTTAMSPTPQPQIAPNPDPTLATSNATTNVVAFNDILNNVTPTAPFGTTPPAMVPSPQQIYFDPGLKNPYFVAPNGAKLYGPQIPPRRLFQIPDVVTNSMKQSNASENGDSSTAFNNTLPNVVWANDLTAGTIPAGTVTPFTSLNNTLSDLIINPGDNGAGVHLGDNNVASGTDYRQHPYFRNELMAKMMNLSTVRTHQYAVWVTVGFFEVIKPGNPSLATTNPASAADQLGAEVGLSSGRNTRYRGFFVMDRTLATGFNATQPGDFRDVITYRRRIE